MEKVKFKTEYSKTKYGWSRWVNPVMKGYLMKCCDCGLVHELDFRVFFESKTGKKKWGTLINDKSFKVEFRAKRKKKNVKANCTTIPNHIITPNYEMPQISSLGTGTTYYKINY